MHASVRRWSTAQLGRTGVKVSPLCLGAMMFGAWGNPDHDDSIRIIHRALDAGHQLRRHRRRLLARRVRGDRRQGARAGGATTSCSRPSSTARWATTRTSSGNSRRWIMQRGRGQPAPPAAPTGSTSTRCTGPSRTPTSTRRSARSPTSCAPGKIRYFGSSTFPAHADRRGAVGGRAPRPRAVRHASSRRTRCSCAAIEARRAAGLRALRHGRDPVEPAGRRLAVGRVPQGRTRPPRAAGRAASRSATTCRCPRTSASSRPPTRSRGWPTEAGLTLIQLALAFVLQPPGGDVARSSARARWSSSRASSARADVDARPPTCSTGSTRSSRPAPTSTPPTRATCRLPSPIRFAAAGSPSPNRRRRRAPARRPPTRPAARRPRARRGRSARRAATRPRRRPGRPRSRSRTPRAGPFANGCEISRGKNAAAGRGRPRGAAGRWCSVGPSSCCIGL